MQLEMEKNRKNGFGFGSPSSWLELEKGLRGGHLLRINCKVPAHSLKTKVISCVNYH